MVTQRVRRMVSSGASLSFKERYKKYRIGIPPLAPVGACSHHVAGFIDKTNELLILTINAGAGDAGITSDMKSPACPAYPEVAPLGINANHRFARGTLPSRTSNVLLTLATASPALVLTGCIPFAGAIPSITRPIIAGKKLTPEDVAFVQPGMTTD